MADNIDEEHLGNSTSNQSENPSDEIIPANDTETINPNQETENMEVHHHPDLHHKPKKWKEYFLEFLMIFLAVTMGFFAESYREHIVNKEIEQKSIETLVSCLASDTTQLENVIKANIKVVGHLDSLVQLRNADLNIEENKRNFLKHSIVGFSEDWYFTTNDAATQQLKSSGTLRLIHKQNIVDSIFKYEEKNKLLIAQQADCYFLFRESYLDYKKVVGLFFYRDTSVMKYSLGYGNSNVEFKNTSAVSISTDREKVNLLFGDAALMAAPQVAYINLMQDQLVYGKNLIAFLKKEYDLQ
jgi:hypothetical protein